MGYSSALNNWSARAVVDAGASMPVPGRSGAMMDMIDGSFICGLGFG